MLSNLIPTTEESITSQERRLWAHAAPISEYFSMIYSAVSMAAMYNHVEPCTAVLKMQ
jgi:hypothetical protein